MSIIKQLCRHHQSGSISLGGVNLGQLY